MDLTRWSTDPGSNDLIDPACPWPEGMAPRQANNSSRGMMAAVAAWLEDTTGNRAAAGGPRAYTLQTGQDIQAFSGRLSLAFLVTTPNAGPATLAVNGLQAKALRRRFNRELGPRDLVPGVIYRVAYVPSNDTFVITSPEIASPGALCHLATGTPDEGWLIADGRAVSRTDYLALFLAIGATYGAGDGATTFNLPDLRGRALVAQDLGAGRLTGAGGVGGNLGDTGGAQASVLTSTQLPSHTHTASMSDAGGAGSGTTGPAGGHDHGALSGVAGGHGHIGTATNAGVHGHSGSASPNGAHTHDIQNQRVGATGGSAALFVVSLGPGGANTVSSSESNGQHGHTLTIDPGGEHSHPLTIDPAPGHQHGIPAVTDHVHSFPGTPPHTHALTINPAGGADPVSRMQPSLVVAIAIKA